MRHTAIVTVALTALGCASTQLPPSSITETESAIVAAETVGAAENPKAELHLKLARDQLRDAELLADAGEEEKAIMTLDRARQDAELALALTREIEARERAHAALQRVKELENKR